MEFDSLQSYLEYRFSDDDTISDSMLKEAKQEWRKMYLSRYHKQYRDKYIQISFRLAKKDYTTIKKLAEEENTNVTSYIKRIVIDNQKLNTTTLDVIPLLEAIDLVEEAIYENTLIETNHLLSLLEQCHDR